MSWLVNSLATSLNLEDDDDDAGDEFHPESTTFAAASTATSIASSKEDVPSGARKPSYTDDDDQQIRSRQMKSFPSSSPSDDTAGPRGVKEDLSELSDTFTRQLWGVASFLAPPPQISDRDPQSDYSDEDCAIPGAPTAGIGNDWSELDTDFRTGISNIVQFGSEEEEEEEVWVEDYARRGVVGVTEEIVAFARDIALHPETWIDFPLPDDDMDEDFELSEAQQEHASALERLAPELAAIRIELCLSYMSESCFWKIYFALVHPRLSRHDAEILSTPEIVKARAMLSQELHSHSKLKPYESVSSNASADNTTLSREEGLPVPVVDHFESIPVEISAVGPVPSVEADEEMDKHAVVNTDIPVIDKKVVVEPPTIIFKFIDQIYKDDDADDDWLEEVNSEAGPLKGTSYPPGDYDDISFSDLEEVEDVPSNYKKAENRNEKVSSDAFKSKGSNDWLDVKNIGIA